MLPRKMVPTKRLIGLFIAGIPIAIMAGLANVAFLFWVYNAFLLVAAIVTYFLAPSVKDLKVRRQFDPVLSVRVPNTIEIFLENDGPEHIVGTVREEIPPFFKVSNQEFELNLPPGKEASYQYKVAPRFRGSDFFRSTFIRVKCPLGLVERDYKLPTEQPVRVYPNILALREFDLLKQKGKLRDIGVRVSRIRGLGTEFESLREYADGDDYRKIDWKATARRNKLIVRQFEQERNQPVIVTIDIGRRMLSEVDGVPKLDLALDNLLMLLHAATVSHDLVGLLVYSDRVVRFIPPKKGRSQMGIIIEAIHNLVAEPIESDHHAAFAYLASRWKRRALIVSFTDTETEKETQKLASALSPLTRSHLLVLARVSDPHLRELTEAELEDSQALFAKAAALTVKSERKRSTSILSVNHIHGLEAEPQDLAAALVSFYFHVKERSLL